MNRFVGREAELDAVLGRLRAEPSGTVALVGGYGIGKTQLLRRLREVARQEVPDGFVLPVDDDFSAAPYGLGGGYSGLYGDDVSSDVLRLLFDKSIGLLRDIVAGVRGDHFSSFAHSTRRARSVADSASLTVQNSVQVGWRATARDVRMHLGVDDAPAYLRNQLRAAQNMVDEAFLRDWEDWTLSRRVLLALDDFEGLVDDIVGQWFVRLAARLRNALVVVPVLPSEHAKPLIEGGRAYELARFTLPEVGRYLGLQLGAAATPGLASVVFDFTGGHPFGMDLVTTFVLEQADEELDAGRLRRTLARLPSDPGRRAAELVRALAGPGGGNDLLRAVEAISAVHFFDAPLLARLLEPAGGGGGTGDTAVAPLIGHMERFGLLEILPGQRFRMHEFVRVELERTVRRRSPALWRELQERAAAYYYDQVRSWEEKVGGAAYGSWYKYEDALWQAYEDEWLYHSAQLPDERDLARTRFASVFLEAFWWWGCYVEFPFCRRLLDNWERATVDADDEVLLQELRRFLDNYPPGYGKAGGSHWTEVRRALRRVRDICGLRGGWLDDRHGPTRARALALMQIFTAHSWWYDGEPGRAEREYARVVDAFERLEDRWVVAWLCYERADVNAELREVRSAAAHCRRAAEILRALGTEEGVVDEELVANLHRCLADLRWHEQPIESARGYGRAVLHALLFQSMPNALDHTTNPPDEYTRLFYEEITNEAGARIAGALDRDDLPALLAAMVEPLRPAAGVPEVVGTHAAEVAAALFPAGPLPVELHRSSSPFLDRWGDVQEDVDSDPLADLDQLIRVNGALAG